MNNFLYSILYFLIRYSCKFNLITLPAYFIFFSLRKIKKIKYGKINKRYLVLHKSVGIDDLTTAFQSKESNIEFLIIKRKIIKILYSCFIKNDHRSDYNYFTKNTDILYGQKKYNEYLFKLFSKLHKIIHFNGFINFNVFYKCEVELQKVSQKLELKFYSIHKEAMTAPRYSKCAKWIYSNSANKFYGTKILTYNMFEKKLLTQSKVCTANKIKIIGMPRLINSLKLRGHSKKNKLNKNIILYFFNPRYLPKIENPYLKKPKDPLFQNKTKINFSKLQSKSYELLYEVLKKRPEVKLTIKSKDGFPSNTKIFNKFKNRVNFVHGGSGHELLNKNGIVLAFNGSTVVFEALAAGKIVFSPYQNLKNGEIFNFKKCTICSNSKSFLIKKLISCVDNKYIQGSKNKRDIDKLLNLYLYNIDGKAGERLIKELN